jgi:hypothetical protein
MVGYLVDPAGYNSATRSYVTFCSDRGLVPWPTDGLLLSAWLYRIASCVKFTSMKMYLSGVRYSQILEGHAWVVSDYEYVRRTLHWIRRKFPCDTKGKRFAVTLSLLRQLFKLLPGWPTLSSMSHDDRLFASASWTAVCSFMRGGEFLASPGSKRKVLCASAMSICVVQGRRALVVAVPQPKATPWLKSVSVPCFASDDNCCPVKLYEALVSGSPFVGSPSATPAFHRGDGSPLSRAWLIQRTAALCKLAGIAMVDEKGKELSLKMASWRAGGVRTAISAGESESMIMELGRWKSGAWRHYLLHTALDVQGAALRMWTASQTVSVEGSGLLVEEESEIGSSSVEVARDDAAVLVVQKVGARKSGLKRKAVSAPLANRPRRVRKPYHRPTREL